MNRVLLVEDETSLREGLKLNLEMEGYEVVAASDGKQALKYFHDQHFDILVLDVMLPEVDGFQIAEQVRLTNTTVPIIFLTAKDATQDRIQGLKRGGDDYLTKPFDLEEFLLRLEKLLARSHPSSKTGESGPETYQFGDAFINFKTFEAKGVDGIKFNLTKKEAMLLKLLIDRKGEVVSRQHILQSVWGYDVYPSTRTIDNFILAFRKHFETDPKNPRYFQSIRGVGYKFTES